MIQEYNPEDSPYSFGTTPIYNTLFKRLTDEKDDTDILCVNLSTIVRNVSSKTQLQTEYKDSRDKAFPFNVLVDDIVKESEKEIKLFVNDVVQMFTSKDSALPRYIYVFMGDIRQVVPTTYYRDTPPGKQHIAEAIAKLRSKHGNKRTETEIDKIKIIELYTTGRIPVFRELEKEIRHLKNNHNVIEVSSHPLDYHLCHYVGNWCAVKSFTGHTVGKDSLGEHVFGQSCLPFTERLHVLLGDKYDIKQCINQKSKKELLEVAEKESWNLKSTDYTNRRLSHLNYITPYTI